MNYLEQQIPVWYKFRVNGIFSIHLNLACCLFDLGAGSCRHISPANSQ